jgi:hypothetical protein
MRGTAKGVQGVAVYVVVTPATGDLRRIEEEKDELAEATLARAIAAARPGDIVALVAGGSISRVWTAPPG